MAVPMKERLILSELFKVFSHLWPHKLIYFLDEKGGAYERVALNKTNMVRRIPCYWKHGIIN